jgi:hypothetical protein
MYRNTTFSYNLLYIVGFWLFMPSLLTTIAWWFSTSKTPPPILFYLMAAPWICIFDAEIYCSILKRKNLKMETSEQAVFLAFEILERENLDEGFLLKLKDIFIQKTDCSFDSSFICRVLARDEKLRSLIQKGEFILSNDLYK